MTLRLSDAQLDLVSRVQTTLLSPRDAPTVAAWVEEVVDATDRLFSTDRTAMILPHAEGLEFAGGPGLTPFLPAMARVLGAVEEGAIHFTEPHVEAAHAVRRARRIEVWSNPMLAELTGTPIERSGWFWGDFLEPAGVAGSGGLAVPLFEGEALLVTVPGAGGPSGFGDEWLDVARLLLPAFRTGVQHLQRSRVERDRLLAELDTISSALWIFDEAGNELYRNASLEALIDATGQDPGLVRAATTLAEEVACLPRQSRPTALVTGERDLRLGPGRYRLRAVLLEGHDSLRGAVLIEVEGTAPLLPGKTTLQRMFGLTPRQSEVALLLARGWTDPDIARELSIKVNTVRSHAEVVLMKLGLNTRKAMALRLLEAARRSSP